MSEREVSWLEDPGRTVNTRREGLLQEDLWYPDGGSDSEMWNFEQASVVWTVQVGSIYKTRIARIRERSRIRDWK